MVSIGSGGAIRGEYFILNRLPYAKGLQYEHIFWALKRVHMVNPRSHKPSSLRTII